MADSRTVLVTVTYGDRARYVEALLERALDGEGIATAVVVSNGSRSDFSPLQARWGGRLLLVALESNQGSANGYVAGIQAALDLGAETLWLMDDDNVPRAGTVNILQQALGQLVPQSGPAAAAVLGSRENLSEILADPRRAFPRASHFLGFHVADIPAKILRRIGLAAAPPAAVPEILMPYAPYGGFMAHREAFLAMGLPRRDFVLYADDWEYTMRLTEAGGRILLVRAAGIDDLEPSWHNEEEARRNSFVTTLCNGSDFRVYYALRNHVWLCRYRERGSALVYAVNRALYLFLLSFFAARTGRQSRAALMRRALADGEAGRLGIAPDFPLP